QRVDDRDADAVQSARHLVAAAVAELAAGVEHGEDHLEGRPALLLHRRNRDAATVVDDGDRVVGMDRDVDLRGVAGQGLVDGVVDHLVDEVMQTAHAGRPDVHAGALADGLETLEDGDVLSVVRPGFPVLRHVPPNDVKNPGCGCPTPDRGASDLWTQMIADRGVSPAPTTASKLLQNRGNCRACPTHPDHPRADTAWQRSDRTAAPPR